MPEQSERPVLLYHAHLARYAILHLEGQLRERSWSLLDSDIYVDPNDPKLEETARVQEETRAELKVISREFQAFEIVYRALEWVGFPNRQLNEWLAEIRTDTGRLRDQFKQNIHDRGKIIADLKQFVEKLTSTSKRLQAILDDLDDLDAGRNPQLEPAPQDQSLIPPPVLPEAPVTTIRFLLFADLHSGMAESREHYYSLQHALFITLAEIAKSGWAPNLLVFAGDLVNRGAETEFDKDLPERLDALWKYFEELHWSPMLLPVPGNHDLERPKEGPAKTNAKALVELWKNENTRSQFWNQENSAYRAIVRDAFQRYQTWWDCCRVSGKCPTPGKDHQYTPGMLPGDYSCSYTFSTKDDTVRLGIVALNTAFLQLLDEEDLLEEPAKTYQERLSLHLRQFHEACAGGKDGFTWTADQDAVLLLTHHPLDWLEPSAQCDLQEVIYTPGNFLAHLHGHMHSAQFKVVLAGSSTAYTGLQSPALYGEEPYYDAEKQKQVERLHGFCLGEIRFTQDHVSLHVSPYALSEDRARFVPNHAGRIRLDPDGWAEVLTVPRPSGKSPG